MGISGRIASAFLRSKLTPLVSAAALGLGALAIVATPREEEPQISVPMIDVFAALPGAGPAEVENLLIRPIERRLWSIPGVDYVYSTSSAGGGLVTARFEVGEPQEPSVVKVHAALMAAMDQAPPGALPPLVQPHTIDDVPILTLTLHSRSYGSNELRQVAERLMDEIRTIPDVAATTVTGGSPRQIRAQLDPARLAARGVTAGEVFAALGAANARLQAGEFVHGDRAWLVDVGAPLRTAADAGSVVVTTRGGAPVYLRDVAVVRDGFGDVTDYVTHLPRTGEPEAAVTISVAKRKGANATRVAAAAIARVEQARGRLVPGDVEVGITRNYGETASDKAGELILHLLIATLSVTVRRCVMNVSPISSSSKYFRKG